MLGTAGLVPMLQLSKNITLQKDKHMEEGDKGTCEKSGHVHIQRAGRERQIDLSVEENEEKKGRRR